MTSETLALGHTIDQIATLIATQCRAHNAMWTNTDAYAQVFSAASSRQAAQARAVMAKIIDLEWLSSIEASDTPCR